MSDSKSASIAKSTNSSKSASSSKSANRSKPKTKGDKYKTRNKRGKSRMNQRRNQRRNQSRNQRRTVSRISVNGAVDAFIKENSNLFKLKRHDKPEYRIDLENITKLIKRRPDSPFFKFLKLAAENATYIDYEAFNKIYNKNADEIQALVDLRQYTHIILILDVDAYVINKSNYMLTLYFYKLLNARNLNIIIVPTQRGVITRPVIPVNQKSTLLYVLCDDIVYSGNQLSDSLDSIINRNKLHIDSNFYLGLIGYTPAAKLRINAVVCEAFNKLNGTHICNATNIIYGRSSLEISNNVGSLLEKHPEYKHPIQTMLKNEFKLYVKNTCTAIAGDFRSIIYNSPKLTLSYVFFKYPDEVSTLPYLCGFNNGAGEELLTYDEIQSNPACSNKYDADKYNVNMIPSCKEPAKGITSVDYCNQMCITPFYKTQEYLVPITELNNQIVKIIT